LTLFESRNCRKGVVAFVKTGMWIFLGAFLVSSLGMSGCKQSTTPKSPIVTELEGAGAGNLDNGFDGAQMVSWLKAHPAMVARLSPECKAAKAEAGAGLWDSTPDGAICKDVWGVETLNGAHKYDNAR